MLLMEESWEKQRRKQEQMSFTHMARDTVSEIGFRKTHMVFIYVESLANLQNFISKFVYVGVWVCECITPVPCSTRLGLFTCQRAFPHELTSVEGNLICRAWRDPPLLQVDNYQATAL